MKKQFLSFATAMLLATGLEAQDFKLNSSGYFENAGANVMVFSDVYPEGHQGGVTLVTNGNRRAAGGDVRLRCRKASGRRFPSCAAAW